MVKIHRALFCVPAGILLVALLAAPAPAEAAQKATLMLNWLPGGMHVPLYYAQQKGYYQRAGLILRIRSARGSRAAMQGMVGGDADFALAEASELFTHRSEGRDTRGLMVYFARSPNAILTLERSKIQSISDLAGKRIGAPRSAFPRLLFSALGKAGKVKLTALQWQNMAPRELLPALIEGRVDAVTSSSIVAHQYRKAARSRGKRVGVLSLAAAGVNPYSLVLASMDSVLAKSPGLIKTFVNASAEGIAAAIERPRDALEVFLKVNPALGRERITAEWRAALPLIYPPEARRRPLGQFDRLRISRMKDILSRIRRLAIDAPIDQLYTNQHLPALRPTPGSL